MKQHVRERHQRDVVTIARAHDGFLSAIVIKFPILSCWI
jgi:predicted kinase